MKEAAGCGLRTWDAWLHAHMGCIQPSHMLHLITILYMYIFTLHNNSPNVTAGLDHGMYQREGGRGGGGRDRDRDRDRDRRYVAVGCEHGTQGDLVLGVARVTLSHSPSTSPPLSRSRSRSRSLALALDLSLSLSRSLAHTHNTIKHTYTLTYTHTYTLHSQANSLTRSFARSLFPSLNLSISLCPSQPSMHTRRPRPGSSTRRRRR
jgi:hypothetical protein